MRVVINLVPVSIGGGLQNALSLLRVLSKTSIENAEFVIFCRQGSVIEQEAKKNNLRFISFPNGMKGRLLFEAFYGWRASRDFAADVVFTLFGAPPLGLFGIKKVSGFAYSNIIQTEVDFWGWLPWRQRLKKIIIDFFRYWSVMRSDVIIVETDYLRLRAINGVFKGKDLRVVKMAPSSVVTSALSSGVPHCVYSDDNASRVIRVLYLSGEHPNKRIHLLAPIFFELSKSSLEYKLITTLPQGNYLQSVVDAFSKYGIAACHENIGPVAPSSVAGILRGSQALINVAKLESFSNNWVEAWAADLPLIVTDAEWARASCGSAAIYVDIDQPIESSKRIHAVLSSEKDSKKLISNGRKMLTSLPSAEERTRQYLEILRSCVKGYVI